MIYLYVLKSLRDNGYYVGICRDPENRLEKHNRREVKSTRFRTPFELIYTEEYADYSSARSREKEIKNWHEGNSFKKLISGAVRSSNGRT